MRYAWQPIQSTCPLCRNREAQLLYTVTSAQAAQHFVLEQVEPERHRQLRSHIETLWEQSCCRVVHCTACEFGFGDPFVAGDAEFYRLAFSGEGYPAWKWEYDATLQVLRAREPDEFTLLELGAGNGAFVQAVTPALTPKENVLCTEYSAPGQQAIRSYGIQCTATDVRAWTAAEHESRFDVICMFQVLEHLDRLDLLFERLSHIAAPNAQLFIAVPNAERTAFQEQHGGLLDMPPNHIGRWNRQCFQQLGRFGWELVTHKIEPNASYAAKAKTFSIYRYLFKSQDAASLANRIERVKSRPLRRGLEAIGIGCYALLDPSPYWGLRSPQLGLSQWAHLRLNKKR